MDHSENENQQQAPEYYEAGGAQQRMTLVEKKVPQPIEGVAGENLECSVECEGRVVGELPEPAQVPAGVQGFVNVIGVDGPEKNWDTQITPESVENSVFQDRFTTGGVDRMILESDCSHLFYFLVSVEELEFNKRQLKTTNG